MDLYIYYHALADKLPALPQRALAMQAQLSRQYQVKTELKHRPHEKDGRITWMEVYHDVPADFEAALGASVAANQLDQLIDGDRHIEQFLDFSPCA